MKHYSASIFVTASNQTSICSWQRAVLMLCVLIWAAFTAQLPLQAAKPNVVVILADDQGFSDWGCYGSEIATPNLDRLAAEGLRFRQFYNGARCSPTRCSILTGLYPQQAADAPAASLPDLRTDNNVTIAELLKANGYRTYMAGKWHLGNTVDRLPEARGFDQVYRYKSGTASNEGTWDAGNYTLISPDNAIKARTYATGAFYQPDVFGDYCLDFLNNNASYNDGKPFFMYVAFGSAHFPIQAPKAVVDTYFPVYQRGWDALRSDRYANMLAKGVLGSNYALSPNEGTPPNGNGVEVIPAWNTLAADRQADLARRMAIYASMIQKMDVNIGRIVDRLRELGQLDNTLLFVLSDNGGNWEGGLYGSTGGTSAATPLAGASLDNMGLKGEPTIVLGGGWAHVSNTPLRLFKHYDHEGGIRTPMIAHWPVGMSRANQWEDQRGHLIDVMATIVDATGVTYPTDFNGHSVLPLEGISLKPLFTASSPVSRLLGFEHESNRAWISGSWKLVTKTFASLDGSSPKNALELYDLSKDASETSNQANAQPTRTQQMATSWNNWAARVGLPSSELLKVTTAVTSITPAANPNDLFVDTFERTNNTDTDASSTGMWGSRVPPIGANAAYYEGYEGSGAATSIQVSGNALQMAVGNGMSENGIIHNFVGQDIINAGGFSIEMNIQSIDSDTTDATNRFAGFGVGLSQAEAATGGNISGALGTGNVCFRGSTTGNKGVSDFFVELDVAGNVKVWSNGVLLDTVSVGQNFGTLTASFSLTGFSTASTVTVRVFLDGHPVDINTPDPNSTTRSFKWDRLNSNYIGLSCRATNQVQLDNLAIRMLPLGSSLSVDYAMRRGLSGPDTAPDADPDGDSVSNFAEWAFGGNPSVADASVASVQGALVNSTQDFQFEYQRLMNASSYGLRYRSFISNDLAVWTEFTPQLLSASQNEDNTDYEIATLQVPTALTQGKLKVFLRVVAEPAN